LGSGHAHRGLIALVLLALSAAPATAACSDTAVELRSGGAVARFTVELADTDSERAQGLMDRPQMSASSGMLFVYETPRNASFWMKNTLISLDMIFMDRTGTVTRVHERAQPLDTTPIDGGPDVAFVLEINGGLASRLGIGPGSQMRHPAVDTEAAVWPCPGD
jgi:uncharacterized membrane protein (UPF0127 family)